MKHVHIPNEEYLRKKMGEAPNAPERPGVQQRRIPNARPETRVPRRGR